MNWRTTALLFVVLVLLGSLVFWQKKQDGGLVAGSATPTPSFAAPAAEPLLPAVTMQEVQRLEIRMPAEGKERVFVRDAIGNWFQSVPTATQVISQTMETAVAGLTRLSSLRVLSPEANPLSSYGLDQPQYDLLLAARRDSQTLIYHLLVGDASPTGNAYYVLKEGDPRIQIVPQTTIRSLVEFLDHPPEPLLLAPGG